MVAVVAHGLPKKGSVRASKSVLALNPALPLLDRAVKTLGKSLTLSEPRLLMYKMRAMTLTL